MTADIDLACDLTPAPARTLIETLVKLGFAPRAPVDPIQFSDPDVRQRWIDEKGMRVFSMIDPQNPVRAVDIFVEHPIEFEQLWSRAEEVALESTSVRVASIPDLIEVEAPCRPATGLSSPW